MRCHVVHGKRFCVIRANWDSICDSLSRARPRATERHLVRDPVIPRYWEEHRASIFKRGMPPGTYSIASHIAISTPPAIYLLCCSFFVVFVFTRPPPLSFVLFRFGRSTLWFSLLAISLTQSTSLTYSSLNCEISFLVEEKYADARESASR